jgi:hypothetical protein
LVGGSEIWVFAFWENGVLRGPIREMRVRPRMRKSVLMVLLRDNGSVQFGIFDGQHVLRSHRV